MEGDLPALARAKAGDEGKEKKKRVACCQYLGETGQLFRLVLA